MMLEESLKEKSYLLIREFLESINSKSFDILAERFGVSLAVFEEIDETIKDYSICQNPLDLAPYEKIFSLGKNKRPFLDFYEMNEPNRLGIDCTLWSEGKELEAILHVEILIQDDSISLEYKYIGS